MNNLAGTLDEQLTQTNNLIQDLLAAQKLAKESIVLGLETDDLNHCWKCLDRLEEIRRKLENLSELKKEIELKIDKEKRETSY